MDPRGFPTSLPEFQAVFPNDAACALYLERLRWPESFSCSKCGVVGEPYRFASYPTMFRCRACKANTHLTAGTVMQGTHMPLSVWFWAAYLVTTQTPGQSAMQFQRQLGLSRYETAFGILQKLRAGMVRPEREPIGAEHPVEVDEVLIGGRNRGGGRGKHKKIYVFGAVESRTRRANEDRAAPGARGDHKGGAPLKRSTYAGRLRLVVTADRKAATCGAFAAAHVAKGAEVRTDGWQGYDGLREAGYAHQALALDGDSKLAEAHLPLIHTVFSNFKAWLLGTHHGVSQTHLQGYCNEFVFRFNRRFYPMTTFNSVLGLAAHIVPPTFEQLYSGAWAHPAA